MVDIRDREVVSGTSYQLVKIVTGDEGAATLCHSANPLPTSIANTPSVSLSGTPTVNVGTLPDVTLAGTSNVAVQGSLPLPTGASTATLQTTGNTSLSSIDTKLPSRTQIDSQSTTITSSTAETTIVSAVASTFCDLYHLDIWNTSLLTATSLAIRDSTGGTVLATYDLPANRFISLDFDPPWAQTTANNNWTADCGTSTNAIVINALFVKNT